MKTKKISYWAIIAVSSLLLMTSFFKQSFLMSVLALLLALIAKFLYKELKSLNK